MMSVLLRREPIARGLLLPSAAEEALDHPWRELDSCSLRSDLKLLQMRRANSDAEHFVLTKVVWLSSLDVFSLRCDRCCLTCHALHCSTLVEHLQSYCAVPHLCYSRNHEQARQRRKIRVSRRWARRERAIPCSSPRSSNSTTRRPVDRPFDESGVGCDVPRRSRQRDLHVRRLHAATSEVQAPPCGRVLDCVAGPRRSR